MRSRVSDAQFDMLILITKAEISFVFVQAEETSGRANALISCPKSNAQAPTRASATLTVRVITCHPLNIPVERYVCKDGNYDTFLYWSTTWCLV
jgi:hypothetical protein